MKSPNPAFAGVDVPLASTFMLSTKTGKEAYVEPVLTGDRGQVVGNRGGTTDSPSPIPYNLSPTPGYRFTVRVGKPKDAEAAKNGTKLARGANFQCLMSGTPISGDYIKAAGKAGRMGARLMAIVAEGERGRVYLAPTLEQEAVACKAKPEWKPEGAFVEDARAFTPCIYGIREWQHLFTSRQLVALTTFSDLVQEARERVQRDAEKVIGDGLWGIGHGERVGNMESGIGEKRSGSSPITYHLTRLRLRPTSGVGRVARSRVVLSGGAPAGAGRGRAPGH